MESGELGGIAQIPEHEFKEHFREWMEQDDVARCLQAKLRKDLILNFNKTTLGKKLIAKSGASHRLKMSPLILALNTMVAEFLYSQNCHFTLSVFCTEVPYRNTLPDFESVRHFRFSEGELLELFDALCSNWWCSTKLAICKQYIKDKSSSLLFVVLQCLLHRQLDKSPDISEPSDAMGKKLHKHDSKFCQDYHHFRHLNKFLIVLLKKVKEMSINMAHLQAQKSGNPLDYKSINMRKLDSLHRGMNKISENLRQMSLSKRRSKSMTAVVSAINAMGKQFQRCAVGFHQASKQMMSNSKILGEVASSEKSYDDWIHEMKTTPHGKKFLEKVELSLHKTLVREKNKMEEDFQKRLQIQKMILKAKYKQRLAEITAKYTAREIASSIELKTENLEEKLREFELKTKEIHEAAYTPGIKPKAKSQADFQNVVRNTRCNKDTQTTFPYKPRNNKAQSPREEVVQNKASEQIFEQEGQHVNNIMFDARQRVQQLEQESNLLERNIRQYLEKQKSEKKILRESTSSILNNFALEKSILDKKCAAYRSSIVPNNNIINENVADIVDDMIPKYSSAVPSVDENLEANIVPPVFKSALRAAQKEILAKNKGQQRRVKTKPEIKIKSAKLFDRNNDSGSSENSSPCRAATKVTVTTSILGSKAKEFVGSGPKVKSPSFETGESNSVTSPIGTHKPRRQVPDTKNDEIPSSSNGQQIDGDHYEVPLCSAFVINNENGDGDAKNPTPDFKKDVGVNTFYPRRVVKKGDKRKSRVRISKTPREKLAISPQVEVRSSSHSFRYFNVVTGELKSPVHTNK